MANIHIFGASNTCGAWDHEGGWADRLKRYIFSKNIDSGFQTEHMVNNLAADGDDSKKLLGRIEREATHRFWPESENIFIATIGTNDTIYSLTEKALRTSPEDYESNLRGIIKFMRSNATKIVFIGPFPIDQTKVDPIPWLAGYSYRSEYIEQYREIMKKVMAEEKILFLDLYDEMNTPEWKNELMDGVHLNTKMHKFVFEQVRDFCEENKII